MIVLDDKGSVILTKQGDKSSVSFTKDESELFKDAYLIHNHPNDSTFSAGDIYAIVKYNGASMETVVSDGVWILERPEVGWGRMISDYEVNTVNSLVRDIANRILKEIDMGRFYADTMIKFNKKLVRFYEERWKDVGINIKFIAKGK